MPGRVLMVQGTASSVGKSLVAAALCRLFRRRGLSVAPFKSQNMSNNAAAVPGGEIGRAQALQAAAAGIAPTVDMNPVLIKPEADARAQVVLLGRPYRRASAGDYYRDHEALWAAARAALDRLRSRYELVVAEGAGSPAEINLADRDIANMAVARYANAPVLLVADIDPGGMFAQVLGTLALLPSGDRARVAGVIVNKFRGDRRLLEPGLDQLRSLTGLPVLGVLPYLHDLGLAEEDGVALERGDPGATPDAGAAERNAAGRGGKIDIAVLRLPRISNFDDVDPLRLEAGVSLRFVAEPRELGLPDALILPGSKATLDDLEWLRERGFDDGIRWLARSGRSVVGICGGYQMLGLSIDDSAGIEGPPRRAGGLGLLKVETSFSAGKSTSPRRGRIAGGPGFFARAAGLPLEGYEIHAGLTAAVAAGIIAGAGVTAGGPTEAAIIRLDAEGELPARADGAAAFDGRVWGSYLHGIFDLPDFRRAWLASLGARAEGAGVSMAEARERALDRLADAAGAALDMDEIEKIAGFR
ncbi:MAG: cobyric acid synthase [Treponema sp.]|nr:cobyric acid synthase [Treponema sp.]